MKHIGSIMGRIPNSLRTLRFFRARLVFGSIILASMLTVGAEGSTASEAFSIVKARLHETYGQLPLSFEANQGQSDSKVRFLIRRPGSTLFLTATETVLTFLHPAAKVSAPQAKSQETVLRMQFLGANPNPLVRELEELPGNVNYFIGEDRTKWRTNVPMYAKVHYEQLYPGVNLVFYGNHRQLEFDFVVAPGTDPNLILLGFVGMDKLVLAPQGDLVLETAGGDIRLHKPLLYQERDGVRRTIAGGYVLKGPDRVGFQVGPYDATRRLIIDPTLFYSTFLGGSGGEEGSRLAVEAAVDAAGNAYVAGTTVSSNFPTITGAFQTAIGGFEDVFVTKLNPTGSALVYSTYLGGSGSDQGRDIVVDASGNAYVTGFTKSSNFPTTPGAFKTDLGPSLDNGFVAKLNPAGSGLLYSTYLGGTNVDVAFGIAVDSTGHAYVTGKASSIDFPTTPGTFEPMMLGSGGSAFVTKLNPTGSGLVYSTFLSAVFEGSAGFGIAVDALGNAYVTGTIAANTYPTTAGAFQMTYNGGPSDSFVTKLNPTGSALVYSTYLGSDGFDNVHDLVLDSSGNAYVTGQTNSPNFPTTTGAFQTTFNGVADAFVTKLNPTGSGLVYSTYIGGTDNDDGVSIDLDTSGNAYAAGSTVSSNFPTTSGAIQTVFGGGSDVFVSVLNAAGSGLIYSTYLGGNGSDNGRGIAVDQFANAYVTGLTSSTNFPTTAGAFQTTFGGGTDDAFVAKITEVVMPPATPAGKVTGGGSINVPGGTGTFGFIVQRKSADSPVEGQLQHVNQASKAKVHSVAFDSLVIVGTMATFSGTCTVNKAPCTFTVEVMDNGEPGSADTFTILISGGSPEGGTLRRGNIQIHQ